MPLLTDDQIPQTSTSAIANPASINVAEWQARTDPDLLVVPREGEYLYRLKSE